MNRKTWIYHTIITLMLLLTACNVPLDTTPPPPPTEIPTQTPTLHPTPSCPNSSSFGYTGEIQPRGSRVFSMNPQFNWYYTIKGISPGSQEAWGNYCIPDDYYLIFSTGPDFTDKIEVQVADPQATFYSSEIKYNWVLTSPLEPLKVYRWVVVGRSGPVNIYGDQIRRDKYTWIHNDSAWPPITNMQFDYIFRTGPECGVGTTATPILIPVENGISESLSPNLKWEVNTCMPTGFFLQYATSPDFADPNNDTKLWYTTDTNTTVPKPLLDCTTYYWRVRYRILVDYVERHADWSDTQSFYVKNGLCATSTPTFVPPTKTPTYTLVPTNKPPTDTPVPPPSCGDYTTSGECWDHSACKWVDDGTTAPYCTNN